LSDLIDKRYLYNGKELNKDFGLDWYDYGARWYDAAVGRWGQVDPLGEDPNQISESPYGYSWNNPILLVDPDGRCPKCWVTAAKIAKKAYKAYKRAKKAGKSFSARMLKDIALDELYGMVDDVYTLVDRESTLLDRVSAAFDLLVGTDFNKKGRPRIEIGALEGWNLPEKSRRYTGRDFYRRYPNKDVTNKGADAPNVKVKTTVEQFMEDLKKEGYEVIEEYPEIGAKTFSNGKDSYFLRPIASSHDGWTADYRSNPEGKGNKAELKIRIEGEE